MNRINILDFEKIKKNRFGYPSMKTTLLDKTTGLSITYWIHQHHEIHHYLWQLIERNSNINLNGFIAKLEITEELVKCLKIYKQGFKMKASSGDFVFWDIDCSDVKQIILWTLQDQMYQFVQPLNYSFLEPGFKEGKMGIINEQIDNIYDQVKNNFSYRVRSIRLYTS